MAYPGQQYGGHHGGGGGGWQVPSVPGGYGYNPPSYGPQGGGGWAPPPGPPPSQGGGGWAPPPGPPPGGYGGGPSGGYGGGPSGGYGAGYRAEGPGGWAPPTGPPPQISDTTRPYSGAFTSQHPPQNYQQAQQYGHQGGPAHYQPPQPRQHEPYYQYSNCTGRRKALCIGINYVGTKAELRGCHNDAINMQRFLVSHYNYKEEDIVVLMDVSSANSRQLPTRANITAAMQWLVRDAKPNDSLFVHYSGHGGQAADKDGDEDDGYDETILPLDFERAGQMIDDELYMLLVAPLPPGCRLTGVFDSCHSGTVLDLPYVYSTEGKIKEPNLLAEAGQGALQAGMSYLRGDMSGVTKGLMGLGKRVMSGNSAEKKARATRTSPADAIQWSGCKDSQTSADATEAGKATGAMSYAMIKALTENPNQTYQELLVTIRGILASKYSQKPQLSASHPIDTTLMYIQ